MLILPGDFGGVVRELIVSIKEDLEAEGHRLEWDMVGTQLAHGKCITCGLPVAIEGRQGLFSARIGSIQRCSEADLND